MIRSTLAALAAFALYPPALAVACSFCTMGVSPTYRQEAAQAKVVLVGTLSNPRLTTSDSGVTDLHIEAKLRDHAILDKKTTVELPRYVPGDPKDPPRFLLFCDVVNGKLDPYRGVPIKSKDVIDYLKGAMALDTGDRSRSLLYFFDRLEHPTPEIAEDAFREFAGATDQELAQVAGKLSPAKLRGWVKNPKVPPLRASLYAFLLGACGKDEDAELLLSLLKDPGERSVMAFEGLLGGYVQLRPREGWELAFSTLREANRPFTVRYAVVRSLRVFHSWRPKEYSEQIRRDPGAGAGPGGHGRPGRRGPAPLAALGTDPYGAGALRPQGL